MDSKASNRLYLVNLTLLQWMIYAALLLSGLLDSPETEYMVGWAIITTCSLFFSINLAFILCVGIQRIFRKLYQKFLRRKASKKGCRTVLTVQTDSNADIIVAIIDRKRASRSSPMANQNIEVIGRAFKQDEIKEELKSSVDLLPINPQGGPKKTRQPEHSFDDALSVKSTPLKRLPDVAIEQKQTGSSVKSFQGKRL